MMQSNFTSTVKPMFIHVLIAPWPWLLDRFCKDIRIVHVCESYMRDTDEMVNIVQVMSYR